MVNQMATRIYEIDKILIEKICSSKFKNLEELTLIFSKLLQDLEIEDDFSIVRNIYQSNTGNKISPLIFCSKDRFHKSRIISELVSNFTLDLMPKVRMSYIEPQKAIEIIKKKLKDMRKDERHPIYVGNAKTEYRLHIAGEREIAIVFEKNGSKLVYPTYKNYVAPVVRFVYKSLPYGEKIARAIYEEFAIKNKRRTK
jgi:hypothetical protein